MKSENDIRKGFQSKLKDFEAPVPPDGWECVERSLKAASAARLVHRRRWFAGSAAAVLVLLVGSLWFLRNPMDQSTAIVSESTTTPAIMDSMQDDGEVTGETPESSPGIQVQPETRGDVPGIGRPKKSGTKYAPVVRGGTAANLLASWMDRLQLQREVMRRKIDASVLHAQAQTTKGLTSQGDKRNRGEDEIFMIGGEEDILLAQGAVSGDGREPFQISLGGKGGLTGYQQTVNTPMTLRSAAAIDDNKNVENKILQSYAANTVGNTSVMEHDQPVSFGITVSKYIFDDLSIETGLVYSYLHSRVRNSNKNYQADEVQNLHYLGIPINLNYNIFSLGGLDVYASLGGMVEKDVYGEFRRFSEVQTEYSENMSEEMKVEKISQENLQYSINAGVGLSYPIYDRLKIYGKIGGAFYFDANDKYKTIYSDRRVVMDLNLGVRYEF